MDRFALTCYKAASVIGLAHQGLGKTDHAKQSACNEFLLPLGHRRAACFLGPTL